jgi:hypothetical protein
VSDQQCDESAGAWQFTSCLMDQLILDLEQRPPKTDAEKRRVMARLRRIQDKLAELREDVGGEEKGEVVPASEHNVESPEEVGDTAGDSDQVGDIDDDLDPGSEEINDRYRASARRRVPGAGRKDRVGRCPRTGCIRKTIGPDGGCCCPDCRAAALPRGAGR